MFSSDFWGAWSVANLLNWLATLLVLAVFTSLATTRAGADPALTWFGQMLTAALLGVHGLWLATRKPGDRELEMSILWAVPLLLWMLIEGVFLTPRPVAGLVTTATLAQAVVVCWVVAHQVSHHGQLKVLFGGCVLLIMVAGLVGLCQYLDFSYLLPMAWSGSAGIDGRAAGPFFNPTALGLVILAAVFPLLAFSLVRRFSPVSRLFFGYLGVLLLLCFFFTFSVAAALALVIGFLILPKAVGTSRRKRFAGWLFSGAFLMAVMLLISVSDALFEAGKRDVLRRDLGSGLVWRAARDIGFDAPVLGSGSGTFGERFEAYRPALFGYEVGAPGSTIATVWAGYGGLGVGLMLIPAVVFPVLWIRWFRHWNWYSREELNRRRKRVQSEKVIIASSICALFGIVPALLLVDGFRMPVVLVACSVLAGFIFQVGRRDRAVLTSVIPLSRRLACAGGGILAAVGWVWLFGSAVESARAVAKADQWVRTAQSSPLKLRGDVDLLQRARSELERAAALQPSDAGIWTGLAWVDVMAAYRYPARMNELGSEIVASSQRALDIFPHSHRAHLTLGLGRWISGDSRAALESLEEARALAPNDFITNYYLSAILFGMGERELAMERIGHAGQLRPNDDAVRRLRQVQSIPGRRWAREDAASVSLPPLPTPGRMLFQTEGSQ